MMTSKLLDQLSVCIEHGKKNAKTPFPPELKGQDGAVELVTNGLEQGMSPAELLGACSAGMERVGDKFANKKVFIPELLIAAKAMKAVMKILQPYFKSGDVKAKGTFVLGTVAGDLHDIGKNLVGMVVEGSGWEVIDLGTDVKPVEFLEAVKEHPGCAVGLSALLTTTMPNMAETVELLKKESPETKVVVGGAPLNPEHAKSMGADVYQHGPKEVADYLNELVA